MDAWSHLVFAFTIGIIVDFYQVNRAKKMFVTILIIEFINLGLALMNSDYYNLIGLIFRGPLVGYFIYCRYTATTDEDKAIEEKMIAMLFFAGFVAAASHNYDLLLDKASYLIIGDSIRRGHNLWHTPFYAIFISLFILSFAYLISNQASKSNEDWEIRSSFWGLYAAALIGYFSHILGDILVFDFRVYWLFPFDQVKLGILDIINHGIKTKMGTAKKPEGTTYYWGNLGFTLLFSIFVFLKMSVSSTNLRNKFK